MTSHDYEYIKNDFRCNGCDHLPLEPTFTSSLKFNFPCKIFTCDKGKVWVIKTKREWIIPYISHCEHYKKDFEKLMQKILKGEK